MFERIKKITNIFFETFHLLFDASKYILNIVIMFLGASEQYKIVNELFDEYKSRGVVSGDKWYLLDYKWYENCKDVLYVTQTHEQCSRQELKKDKLFYFLH